jgi:uncharacterized glyoxalase superfamily protein PhnB
MLRKICCIVAFSASAVRGSLVAVQAPMVKSASQETSHRVMVRVNEIDQHFEQAVRSGAIVHARPTTHPFGERQYTVEDFAGHMWTFSESISDVDPREWGGELIVTR